jgi:hypothetical protein
VLFHTATLLSNCCKDNRSDKVFAVKKLRKSKHECALENKKAQAGVALGLIW